MDLVDQAELFDVLIFVSVVREVVVPLVYAWYVKLPPPGEPRTMDRVESVLKAR